MFEQGSARQFIQHVMAWVLLIFFILLVQVSKIGNVGVNNRDNQHRGLFSSYA